MRRPLALAGFTLLCTNLLCLIWGTTFALALGGTLLILLLVLLLCKRNNNRLWQSLRGCCFFALAGCCLFALTVQMNLQPLTNMQGTTKYTEFSVLDELGSYEEKQYYLVSAKGCYPNNPQKECSIRLCVEQLNQLTVGDVAGGMVTFSQPGSNSLTANRIYLTGVFAQEASPNIIGKCQTSKTLAYTIRCYISEILDNKGTVDTLALVQGICLGDAKDMSGSAQRDFYSCGLGHLVAVSGLHTNQVGAIFIALFLLLLGRKRWVKLCSLLFVWGFVWITGFSFSSLRAAIMFSFFGVGSCVFRKMDSLNTLGGAVTAILLCNPLAVGNVGFLASVSACLGLILLATPLEQKLTACLPKKWKNNLVCSYCIKGLAATLSATVATIPCNFLAFRSFSLVAPLANLLCVPFATFILILGYLGMLCCSLPPLSVMGELFLWLAHGMASFVLKVAELLAKLPYHTLTQGTLVAFLVFIVSAVFLFWFLYQRPFTLSKGFRIAIILLVCCGIVFSATLPAFPATTAEVCFLANEYDGALVAVNGKTAVFIGSSMTYELEQYLYSRGINTLSLWVIPKRSNASTAYTTIAQQWKVEEIMVHPLGEIRGILTPFITKPPISNSTTKTVGNFTVTTNTSFKSFVLSFNETQVYYADTKWDDLHGCPVAFVNRKATNSLTHSILQQSATLQIHSSTVLRITKTKTSLYQPKFLF